MSAANTRQVGGGHYRSVYQHWDFAHEAFGDGYFQGQITKYVFRWRRKNGLEDLNKAAHFLQKLIELREKESSRFWCVVRSMLAGARGAHRAAEAARRLIELNDIGAREARIITLVAEGSMVSLRNASTILGDIIFWASSDAVIENGAATRHYVNQDNRGDA